MGDLRQSLTTYTELFWPGRLITTISKLRYACVALQCIYPVRFFSYCWNIKDIFDCISDPIKGFNAEIVISADNSKQMIHSTAALKFLQQQILGYYKDYASI